MKTGNAALLIAAGILLLWIVISQRTKNLSASWQALMGQGNGGADMSAASAGGWGSDLSSIIGNTLPSNAGTPGQSTNPVLVSGPDTPTDPTSGGATMDASNAAAGYGGMGIPSVATNPGPGSFTNVVGDAMPSLTQFAHNAVANSIPANTFGPQWNLAIVKQGTY